MWHCTHPYSSFVFSLVHVGPFKVNRVPLRRVNQSYVIATQTKVDVTKLDIPEQINDEYFKRITINEKRTKGKSADIFQDSDKVCWMCFAGYYLIQNRKVQISEQEVWLNDNNNLFLQSISVINLLRNLVI